MTIEPFTYRARILLCLNNKVINFPDGTSRDRVEWFNQEELHRTMQDQKMGMDKVRLRDFLDDLIVLEFVDKREGKKQEKTQSKGEYKINEEGQKQLALIKSLM
tara:strand:+ start:36 stop:347 length:312 start_codon:yes stop_codon:yes gene_type:complete